MQRILKQEGRLFISVDIGGAPTPDEPTVFSVEELSTLVRSRFDVELLDNAAEPHSHQRTHSVRLLARKQAGSPPTLDRQQLLRTYMERLS
jgi:hypothetical protein